MMCTRGDDTASGAAGQQANDLPHISGWPQPASKDINLKTESAQNVISAQQWLTGEMHRAFLLLKRTLNE